MLKIFVEEKINFYAFVVITADWWSCWTAMILSKKLSWHVQMILLTDWWMKQHLWILPTVVKTELLFRGHLMLGGHNFVDIPNKLTYGFRSITSFATWMIFQINCFDFKIKDTKMGMWELPWFESNLCFEKYELR